MTTKIGSLLFEKKLPKVIIFSRVSAHYNEYTPTKKKISKQSKTLESNSENAEW